MESDSTLEDTRSSRNSSRPTLTRRKTLFIHHEVLWTLKTTNWLYDLLISYITYLLWCKTHRRTVRETGKSRIKWRGSNNNQRSQTLRSRPGGSVQFLADTFQLVQHYLCHRISSIHFYILLTWRNFRRAVHCSQNLHLRWLWIG